MYPDEIILIVSLILFPVSLVVMSLFEKAECQIGSWIAFAFAALSIGGMLASSLYIYGQTTTISTEPTVITIQDKIEKTETHFNGKVHRTHTLYYFTFEDDRGSHEIETDKTTYDKYNKGDTFYIKKTTTYKVDRETKEIVGIESISYN